MRETSFIVQRDIPNLPDGTHRVDVGLYLRVRGKYKNFFFRGTFEGKRIDVALGSANEISVNVAKAKALKIRAEIASGDFVPEKEKKKEEKRRTFADIATEAIEATKNARRWKNEKHAAQWTMTITVYACPVIGEKFIDEITRDDILDVILPMWESKTETATRLLSRLERIFDYASFVGLYNRPNPAKWKGNLDMLLPMPSKVRVRKHHEALTPDEAKQIAPKLSQSPFISHKAVLFGILTACRVQEFIFATWDEIDIENAVFCVPAERRKDGKNQPHRVPLSKQALDLLKTLDRTDDLVFPSPTGGRMSIDTCRVTLVRFAKRPVTMHGCRSTFRDWCASSGIDPILAEKSLMHSTGSAVVQAYQRSDLLDERRPVMQAWADAILN